MIFILILLSTLYSFALRPAPSFQMILNKHDERVEGLLGVIGIS